MQITILGRDHAVSMPTFAEAEELSIAWCSARASRNGMPLRRVYAAALGLCTRLGRESGADYAASGCSVLAYGGEVYSWLREQGAGTVEIGEQAAIIMAAVLERTFPRQVEVEAEKKGSASQVEISPPSDSV